jgi:hypothetical protein
MSFEEDVIDRLARMEVHLADLPIITTKVEKLEAHRNYTAGALAILTAVSGYIMQFKH